MVHLLTVSGAFQARVLAARLGSEGIVTELRGAIDGPYPCGEALVFVEQSDLDLARQLLLADEVEEAFAAIEARAGEARRAGPGSRALVPAWAALAGVVVVAFASAVARIAGI